MSENELIDRVLAYYSKFYHGVMPDFRMKADDKGFIFSENGVQWNIMFTRDLSGKEPNVFCKNCNILLELARGYKWLYLCHEYVRNPLYGCESNEELEMRLDIIGEGT